MTYGTASPGSDRLPWLPDERRAPRIGASAIILACVVWIAVVAAAVSYSPWRISLDAFDFRKPRASAVPDAPVARPVQRPAENYGNLQILPAPDSAAPSSPTPVPVAPAIPTLGAERPTPPPPVAPEKTAAVSAGSSSPSSDASEAAPSPPTQSADVDCRLAKTRTALAVCRNRSLAALDREHALIYNQSWRYADNSKRALLQRARQKMASNLNACQTDACTSGIYLAAMREVSGIMSAKTAPSAPKPSFSCRGARKPGQIAVCRDPNLAALDRHQALLYSQSLGRADRAKRLRLQRAHRRLVAERDKCGSEQCAKSVYLAAMKEVADIMTNN